uniref:Secreted protein n=1 Tax=Globodera pallida TaxID=36090 RepID=A0A183CJ80_GLOPA
MGISKSVVAAFALLTALTLPGLSWGDDSASALSIPEGCKKKAAECEKCNWGDCHPSSGFASDGCCSAGHQFKCCETAPEVLTPCEKLAAKCSKQGNNWGECFPRDGYNGDACCEKGNAWKCGGDMTIDELILKDPAYAQYINCYIAGHPDMESLKKCMPDNSECKLYQCRVPYDDIERCPKSLKCLQRKHSNWRALFKCVPNVNNKQRDECNEPLPPIENATEA